MNQSTVSNLTDDELRNINPDQEPFVYEEVFKRFSKHDADVDDAFREGFDEGREEGFDQGYTEGSDNIKAIRDLCSEQKDLANAHPSFVIRALRELHKIIGTQD